MSRYIVRFGFSLFLFLFTFSLKAQTYGDEWIQPGQSYYKIKTAQNGIYRITYEDLTASFPLSGLDPKSLQLFHRGEEQAIFIEGESDGTFDIDDFVEFYGRRNDGAGDSVLYLTPEAQPHKHYNLYSDSSAYFLTWRLDGQPGKRMQIVPFDPTQAGTPEPFHWQEELQLFSSRYSFGRRYPVGTGGLTWLSQFDYGEGWTGALIRRNEFADFVISNINNTYSSGPRPRLEVLLAGWNDGIHRVEILVGSNGSLRSLSQETFNYFDTHLISEELEWSDLASGDFNIRVAVNNDTSDFVSVSYIKLRYPQGLEMIGESAKIFQPQIAGMAGTIEVLNPPTSSMVYQVQDPNNVSILAYSQLSDRLATVVPIGAIPSKIMVTGEPPLSIDKLQEVDLEPIATANYLIISHHSLRQPAGGYGDPVQAYADYRSSPEGGGFNTSLVESKDLYDRFNYGEVSPIAIRRFARKMLDLGDPKYLLLLGKAYNVRFNPYRRAVSPDLVPTIGFPGSDIALTAGLDGTVYESAIPTGRINARNGAQVAAYLDKVKESEAQTGNALWSKNLIHLSGGITNSELTRFKNYVDDFKDLAEGPYLGGQVTTINKRSNETVELINIAEEVNKGVGLITFFGHSAPEITDIEIGDASDPTLGYENQGRYPMILVSGCNAGNIFGDGVGFGEDWIVTADKGALGFAAHTAFGFENNLKRYADVFYGTAYADSAYIHQPIGDVLIEVSKRYLQGASASEKNITQTQQVVFQGDPAVRFFGTNLPDYETADELLFLESFDNQPINALADSFRLGVITRNLGISGSKPLNLGVRRTFSDGQTITYDSAFYAPVSYQDTLYFTIRSNEIANFGENQFEVILDFNETIREANEGNNVGILSAFIPLGGTVNLSPTPFAIVSKQPVRLLAQSSNLLSGQRGFQFELDTAATFDSPWKQSQLVTAEALAQWEVSLLDDVVANDSVVYYWRTKFQTPQVGEDSTWTRSSFIYIKNSPKGWSQSELPQFDVDLKTGININQNIWEFATTDTRLQVTTFGKDHPSNEPANIKVDIAGQAFIVGNRLCATNSMNAVAFDRSTTIPYPVVVKPGFDVLDPNRCGRSPQVINRYNNSEVNSQNKLDQYINLVPDGDYVLLFSIGTILYESWTSDLIIALQTIGVAPSSLAGLQNGEPIIVLGRKGASSGSAIFLTESSDQQINLDQEINGAFDQGSVTSPVIGPALSWKTLNKDISSLEQPSTDQIRVEIIGIDTLGQEFVLVEQVSTDVFDLSGIDANLYPKIKLKAYLSDEANLTPAQLKKWQVIFEPVPEGVITFRGSEYGLDQQLVLEEGAEINARFTFTNISDQAFSDSVTVEYRWFNRDSRVANEGRLKLKSLAPFDSAQFSVSTTTFGNYGSNDLKVFANPRLIPERIYNNNIIDLPQYLQVNQDLTNPILSVTFDGRQIADGEIVSPSPLIEVLLKEDNPFVFKEDTIGMTLAIKYPNCENCDFETIYFSDPNVIWQPASPSNDFTVEYRPEDLPDGTYSLQVQGEDVFGKASGLAPYTVSFEVINAATITYIRPYPNPFSENVNFAFKLTGPKAPEQIEIKIINLAGQVVRTIDKEELLPITSANHTVYYIWNGRNDSGAALANGIYLYQVIISDPGFTFELPDGESDQSFRRGFGKLYLLK